MCYTGDGLFSVSLLKCKVKRLIGDHYLLFLHLVFPMLKKVFQVQTVGLFKTAER